MYQPAVSQPLPTMSMEQSIQAIMNSISTLNTKMDFFMKEVTDLKARVATVEADVKNAYGEIFTLKETVNRFEQRDKALVIRIFGLPLSGDEKDGPDPAKAAAKNAYDRILRPILTHAKEKAIIPSLPGLDKVVTEAFRVRSRTSNITKPPPIVVKLTSSAIKIAIFRAKRDSLPQPSQVEMDAGLRRFHLAEDLTSATFNFLFDLRAHAKVERAWTVDGEIRYTKKDDSTNYVYKVKSIFDGIDILFA